MGKSLRQRGASGAFFALGLGVLGILPAASAASALPFTGSIGGTITVDASGAALAAQAYELDGGGDWVAVGEPSPASGSGAYSIGGLAPGSYAVRFSDSSITPGFASEYYGDQLSAATAELVTVADGQTVTNVDATLTYAGPVPTSRLAGLDRYETSAEIAKQFPVFAEGTGVVYVASGEDYPDGLSAAPAATLAGGPLLLTLPGALPAVILEQINRLAPSSIVVVGGPSVVSASVFDTLVALPFAPAVERQGGIDRYETSRLVTETAFPHASSAFIATGENFPDALSASGAAGNLFAPVILVRGSEPAADTDTLALLTKLGVTTVYVAGGPAVVSLGIETSLTDAGFTVTRLAGSDRYGTSAEINSLFTDAGVVYLAVGTVFADSLSGGALAGRDAAPLYVVPGGCVPTDVLKKIAQIGATRIVLLGGPSRLSQEVASLTHC